jgi:thymidine kinase
MGEFDRGFTFYVGNMFGGKTAQMIVDLQRAKIAGKKVQAFKISWDDRYEEDHITANNEQLKFPAVSVPDIDILERSLNEDVEVLGIDELQFFDERIIDFIKRYQNKVKIIGTSLQFNYRGEPFSLRSVGNKEIDSRNTVGDLMALAHPIIHKLPVCTHKEDGKICGRAALYPQRRNKDGSFSKYDDATIVIGGQESYTPRCIKHFRMPERNV